MMMVGLNRPGSIMEKDHEQLWSVVDEICARNRDQDPDDVTQDVADVIAEIRAERPQAEVVTPQR